MKQSQKHVHKLAPNSPNEQGNDREEEEGVATKRDVLRGKNRAMMEERRDWHCQSVKVPRAAECTMSATRRSSLSRPPASLWEMYASGAGLAGSCSAWAGINCVLAFYYCKMFASCMENSALRVEKHCIDLAKL